MKFFPAILLPCLLSSAIVVTEPTNTIQGTLNLYIGQFVKADSYQEMVNGGFCTGNYYKGFADLTEGTQVVIKDGQGNILGVSQLGRGSLFNNTSDQFNWQCDLPFSISVPQSQFYSIEISHRKGIVFSLEQLQQNNWTIKTNLAR